MTQAEKDRVLSLRQQHHSFSEIAQVTGLSPGTVKSFLSRGSRKEEDPAAEMRSTITGPRCSQCGAVLEQAGHRRERSSCSDQYRSAYWNSHRDMSRRASAHRQTCEVCGRTFFTYHGRYCSQACYGQARAQKAGVVRE